MRTTSGRAAIGLVVVSTWAGACVSEQDKGEITPAAGIEPQVANATMKAADVILAVRTQLTRAFGQTTTLPNERAPRMVLSAFDTIGNQAPKAMEFLGTTGNLQNAAAQIALPERANGTFSLKDASSGVKIDVGLEGATEAAREEANGYVVYRGGYLQGAHVVHRTTSVGTEDYVYFPEMAPEKSELRYRIKLSDGVAGLRLVQHSVEMVDAHGAPRLRMNTPYAVDGEGHRLPMTVAIDDCAYDSSIQIPWGREPVNPGARECTIRLTWPHEAKAPLVVDPQWTLTTDMHEIRLNATSTVAQIADKSLVLVVGGDNGSGAMGASQTTEIYEPESNAWTYGPTLNTARTDHSMVLLGSVPHVIGGRNSTGLLATSEKLLIDGMGKPYWQEATGAMVTARGRPAVMPFEGNGRIFVAGGFGVNESPLKTIEIYDLATGWATPIAPAPILYMTMPRMGHAIVAVPPHFQAPAGALFTLSVLIVGGKSDGGPTPKAERCWAIGNAMNLSVECGYTTVNNAQIPVLNQPRANHVAVYDSDTKKVHVFGGDNLNGGVNNAESYDPMLGMPWVSSTNAMQSKRSFFTVNALQPNSSKYLVAGGVDIGQNSMVTGTVDIYDAKSTKFLATQSLTTPRGRHSAVILPDSRPLVIGGSLAVGGQGTAELMTCTSDDDCAPYNGGKSYCSKEGTCLPQKVPGAQCDIKTDCLEGMECAVCTGTNVCSFDGICCDKSCGSICESCKQQGQVGTCVPVPPGPPPPNHGECLPEGHQERDLKCRGRCDGITRDSCEYLEGKSCGIECVDDLPDRLVPSTTTELVCTSDGFCERGQVSATCGAYTCGDAMSCRVDCKDTKECVAGHVCSKGQCVPGQTFCAKSDPSMPVDDVVQSTIDSTVTPCFPFRCENGACLTECKNVYDCISDATTTRACDDNGACVEIDPNNLPGTDDASCVVSPERESSRFGWLAAVALAGMIAARRNRTRA